MKNGFLWTVVVICVLSTLVAGVTMPADQFAALNVSADLVGCYAMTDPCSLKGTDASSVCQRSSTRCSNNGDVLGMSVFAARRAPALTRAKM